MTSPRPDETATELVALSEAMRDIADAVPHLDWVQRLSQTLDGVATAAVDDELSTFTRRKDND